MRDTPRIRKLSGLNPDVICPIPMRLGMSCPRTGIVFGLHFPPPFFTLSNEMIPGTRQDTMIPATLVQLSGQAPVSTVRAMQGEPVPRIPAPFPARGPGMNDPAVMTVMILLLCKSLIDPGKHDRMP
ncbi:hypothetical protein ASZ90_016197 [hydrocarbon metagenome]|uniref:Uncharacterized protein n=1 Tax=hydrocarbon metagenome TaxID=938273 RepID=A0A0W8F188_9ZZZZ